MLKRRLPAGADARQAGVADVIEELLPWSALGGLFGGCVLLFAAFAYPAAASWSAAAAEARPALNAGIALAALSSLFFLFAVIEHFFRRGGGKVGFVAFAVSVTGLVLMFSLFAAALFGVTDQSTEYPRLAFPSALVLPLTGCAIAMGFATLGWALDRASAFNSINCALLGAGSLLLGLGIAIFGPGLIARAGAALLGAALCWMAMAIGQEYWPSDGHPS